LDEKTRELEKYKNVKIDSKVYFKELQGDKYSKYDEKGAPTHTEKGEALSKSEVKRLKQVLTDHEKAQKKFNDNATKDPDFLNKLKAEIAQLEKELKDLSN